MTATPSSEARANEAADERYALLMPELVHPLTVEEIKSTYAEGWLAGAEWKGAQVKMALIELRDGFRRHGLPQQEAIAIRALSGVESSDEGEADGE